MNPSERNHFWPVAIACGLAFSSIALAADPAAPNAADAQFKAMDTNGDGRLSPDEHAAGAKKMFDVMDTDKDGFVSQAEFAAGHARMLHKRNQ
jgi:hypothetical protein